MQWLSPALLAVQVITSIAIIVLILLQQGKGADMGSSFGGGSAGSLFGASGAANFLSRTTKWAAIIFFSATAGLAYIAHHPSSKALDEGVMQGFKAAPAPAAPSGSAVPSVPGGGAATAIPTVPNAPSTAPTRTPSGAVVAPAPAQAPKSAEVPAVPAPSAPAGASDKAETAPEAAANSVDSKSADEKLAGQGQSNAPVSAPSGSR